MDRNLLTRIPFVVFILLIGDGLTGCNSPVPTVIPENPLPTLFSTSPAPMPTPTIKATQAFTATPRPVNTALPITHAVCSPLQDVPVDQLAEVISNPYQPPPPGSDDPHHGVDFADQDASKVARAGASVRAVMGGSVAATVVDRFPYGNAVILETPLEGFSATWSGHILPSNQESEAMTISALYCPEIELAQAGDPEKNSLYLLYAHLQQPALLQPGDWVECGQPIGAVGDSGNAMNPHLHFEARVGPAGAGFGSLSHYDNSATLEEMSNYCIWRISGMFQTLDPMLLFQP